MTDILENFEKLDNKRIANLEGLRSDFVKLIEILIPTIDDDDRIDEEDEQPSMEVTIACNEDGDAWNYQTGDNSYTGGAYGLPHWAVLYLDRDSDPKAVAEDAIDQLAELIVWS